MEKLSDMFIKGQHTPFNDQPSNNKKHLLSDSTNGKPAKVLMHELHMYTYYS